MFESQNVPGSVVAVQAHDAYKPSRLCRTHQSVQTMQELVELPCVMPQGHRVSTFDLTIGSVAAGRLELDSNMSHCEPNGRPRHGMLRAGRSTLPSKVRELDLGDDLWTSSQTHGDAYAAQIGDAN